MPTGLAAAWMVGAGCLVALQAPINATIGRAIGSLPAAAASQVVGAVVLASLIVVAGRMPTQPVASVPLYTYIIGGVLGALFVFSALVTVKWLGAGGFVAANVSGQLITAIVIDAFGLFGLERHPIDLRRVAAVGLLAAGTALMVR